MTKVKVFLVLFLLSLTSISWGDGSTTSYTYPNMEITEEDGSPSTYPYKLKFPSGGVTDNGDSTSSIFGGAFELAGPVTITSNLTLSGTDASIDVPNIYNSQGDAVTVQDDLIVNGDVEVRDLYSGTSLNIGPGVLVANLPGSTGNVGIGKTAPTTMLDIVQNSASVQGLKVTGADDRAAYLLHLKEGGGTSASSFIAVSTASGTNDVFNLSYNHRLTAYGESGNYWGLQARTASDTSWHGNFWDNYRSRGTQSSQTAVVKNDNIAYFDSWGYDGTGYHRSARIMAFVDGTVSTGSVPMAIKFGTGTTTDGLPERMRITSGGDVGIGTTAPSAKLEVSGDVSAAQDLTIGGACYLAQDYGNVGIGTSAPAYKFVVETKANEPNGIYLDQNTSPYTAGGISSGIRMIKTINEPNSGGDYESYGLYNEMNVDTAMTSSAGYPPTNCGLYTDLDIGGDHSGGTSELNMGTYSHVISSHAIQPHGGTNFSMENVGFVSEVDDLTSNFDDGLTVTNTGARFTVSEGGTLFGADWTKTNYGLYVTVDGQDYGTSTNYGLYLDVQDDADFWYNLFINDNGNSYTGWAIYSESIADSYIEGDVGIGDATPDAKLDVEGDVSITQDLTVGGNVYCDGHFFQNSQMQEYSGTKTLVDNSATGFVDISIGTGEFLGGIIHYSLYVTNGTDFQAHTGDIAFNAINKAGTVTSDIEELYSPAAESEVVSAGTITDDFTVTDGTGKITINCDADSSLTGPTIVLKYTIVLHSINTITPL